MGIIGTIIVCLIAGIGAGLGTGFAGLSAAVVISPMLIAFLDIDAYHAVGIALASDVLASGISAITYKKHGNIDVKNGNLILISVLTFTFVGSFSSSYLPHGTLTLLSFLVTLALGLRFVIWPDSTKIKINIQETKRKKWSLICGCGIGFICGFVGAGGGLAMLMVFTIILGYDLKTAVGTSVYVMTFTALTGAASHFLLGDEVIRWDITFLCIVFTLIFAQIGSKIANKANPKTTSIATGIILIVVEIVVISIEYLAPLVYDLI